MQTPRAQDAERRIAADQWDVDSWQVLASEAEKAPFADAKPVYERLVTQFPPAGRFWKSYAEHFSRQDSSDPEMVNALYERAVLSAPTSIDLWRSYVAFSSALAVKIPGSKLENDAMTVHEKALAAAGLDLYANPLWSHYIDFVKNHTTLSDSQRRDSVRRAHQRAVRNPMQNLDSFWREYSTFEQTSNTNKELGRGLLAENHPKNVDARTEFRARRTRREGLTLSALPVPPSRGRAKESSQAQQWRRFIALERGNPHTLAPADLNVRVIHAFESALGPLYRYPDIWIEYLSYVYESYVKDGQSPQSKSGGKETPGSAREEVMKKANAALEPLLTRAIKALPDNVGLHTHVNWIHVRLGNMAKGTAVLDSLCKRHPNPLAYIQLMRAARKADGRDAARKIFGRARKDPKANDPAVYVAAAWMEFIVNKESKVARNVFEFGLKNYAKSAFMAREYVNWLWGIGDVEYARVVLKKITPSATGSPENVRLLWERWLELEEMAGDPASVDSVENMWREAGKKTGIVQDVMRRSRFLNFEGLQEEDISSIDGVRSSATEKSTGASGAATGKRDPRTGRRVQSTAGNKDATANGGGGGRRNGESDAHATPLQIATEWLHRMAASMLLPIALQAPDPEVAFRMIRETPDAFSDTPAGKQAAAGTGSSTGNADTVAGKKRKGEDIGLSQGVASVAVGPANKAAPAHDVFRARQAAKQSRMR